MNRREAFQTITGLLAGGAAAGMTIASVEAKPPLAERSQMGVGIWSVGRFTFRTFQDIFQFLGQPQPKMEGSAALTLSISADGLTWTNRCSTVECPQVRLWRTFFFPLRYRGDEKAVLSQLDFFLEETDVTTEERTALLGYRRDVAEMRLQESPWEILASDLRKAFGERVPRQVASEKLRQKESCDAAGGGGDAKPDAGRG